MANKGGPKKAAYDKAYGARPEQKEARAQRNAARREAEREGKVHKGDGKDVAHKTAIKNGGTNAPSNLVVQTRAENRSFARGKDGSMKSETSRREKK